MYLREATGVIANPVTDCHGLAYTLAILLLLISVLQPFARAAGKFSSRRKPYAAFPRIRHFLPVNRIKVATLFWS